MVTKERSAERLLFWSAQRTSATVLYTRASSRVSANSSVGKGFGISVVAVSVLTGFLVVAVSVLTGFLAASQGHGLWSLFSLCRYGWLRHDLLLGNPYKLYFKQNLKLPIGPIVVPFGDYLMWFYI